MGAYISIVNDTEHMLLCNVGPDEAALSFAGVLIGVVGAIATLVATAGLAGPVVAGVSSGVFSMGFTVATTLAVTNTIFVGSGVVGTVATAAGFLQIVVDQTIDKIKEEGYVEINPGEKHQWRTDTVSLWRQGVCKRVRKVPGEMTYLQDEVYMRPIFSGATADANIDHTVQFWIDKHGWENEARVLLPLPKELRALGLESWGDMDAPLEDLLALLDSPSPTALPPMPTPTATLPPMPTPTTSMPPVPTPMTSLPPMPVSASHRFAQFDGAI